MSLSPYCIPLLFIFIFFLWEGLATLHLITYISGSFAVMTFIVKNILRNSLIPLANHFGNNISIILMGSFLIETFQYRWFGLLGYESLIERNYPVVMGIR
jgi:microcin C transport system permease protein